MFSIENASFIFSFWSIDCLFYMGQEMILNIVYNERCTMNDVHDVGKKLPSCSPMGSVQSTPYIIV